MTGLRIGKTLSGKPFTLPLDVVSQAMAVHGVRGKGKTVTVSVVVEEVLKRGIQVVVIDPTDCWHGLKSSADGKKEGFPVVVLGGPHGDLPLTEDSGRIIADFVVDRGASMILSLRHLRKGAQRRFVTEFAEHLYHRKGEPEHRTPVFLAIDEASQFAPQKVMGDSARMVGALQDLARMGRHAGIGLALIDQRPASVNKDLLTQIELLVCHAVTSPQDRKALQEWVRQKDSGDREGEFLSHLASLGLGEAWFWCPILDLFERVQVRMRETFDSSRTPKIGEAAPVPEKLAAVDLNALRSALEETVGKAEANDPKVLKRRIAELEKELRDKPAGGVSEQEVLNRIQDEVEPLARELEAYRFRIKTATPFLEEVFKALRHGESTVDVPYQTAPIRPARAPAPAPRPPTPVRQADSSSAELSGPQSRILNAVAWLEGIGVEHPKAEAVAFIAGYRPGGGAFNNPKGSLRSLGLIDYPAPGLIALTSEGRNLADAPDVPPSLVEFHQLVLAKLDGPEQRILRPLLDVYPHAMGALQLADASGYSQGGGAFNNPKGRLRTLGLIDYPRSGMVVATPVLFPEGVR